MQISLVNNAYRNLNLLNVAALIKIGEGSVNGWHLYTNGSADRFVKIWDKATAPVIGVDAPKLTIGVKPAFADDQYIPGGIHFRLGIWIACTTGMADTNTAAPPANSQMALIFYE